MSYEVHHGDCLEVMKSLPDNSVDAVVTDPPYGLSFMGKRWDYDVPSVEIWQEVLRVLKPGGHLLSFGGTRTYHRMVVNIEDAGFEIRDQIQWIYGSGFPKSLNVGNGFGTALKPANEPICLARKPLIGTVAENVKTHGTGAINIDGCRVELNGQLKTSGGCKGNTNPVNINLTNNPKENNNLGRFPANVIHDGSDEVVGLFPQTTSGALKPYKENHINASSFQFEREKTFTQEANSGSAARFFYCPKASKADRNAGLEGFEEKRSGGMVATLNGSMLTGSGNERTTTNRNNHPTVKPTELMRYLCRLITPPNGTVLDPFAGSGSTGKAAILEGFSFIGIEREEEYAEIARARIAHVSGGLFV